MNGRFLKETSRGIDIIYPEDKLLEERKIFFTEEVNAESSNKLIQYLLCLEAFDSKKPITVYINSPGGEVVSGLAVYDTIKSISCPVNTVCIGTAASMGSIIFMAGKKREMLPHTKIMIHDPLVVGSSGAKKVFDLEREAGQLMETRKILGGIIAQCCGKSIEEVYEKTKMDYFMDAEEAVSFGVATGIIKKI